MDELEFKPVLILLNSGATLVGYYGKPGYLKATDADYVYQQDPLEVKDPMYLETLGVHREDKSVIVAAVPHSIYTADVIVGVKQENIQMVMTPSNEILELYKKALEEYKKEPIKFTSAHDLYKKQKKDDEPPLDPNDPYSKIRDIFSHKKH